ncbi:MAG: hypothetical protein QG661_2296 [Actinomycetota bacterium]|nr:hypothetical protein [Actinomycetota bacterium]
MSERTRLRLLGPLVGLVTCVATFVVITLAAGGVTTSASTTRDAASNQQEDRTPDPTPSSELTSPAPTPTDTAPPTVTPTPTDTAPPTVTPTPTDTVSITDQEGDELLRGFFYQYEAGEWEAIPEYFARNATAQEAAQSLFVRFLRDQRARNRLTSVFVDGIRRCPQGADVTTVGNNHVCGPNAFLVDHTYTRPPKLGGTLQSERRIFELVYDNDRWAIQSSYLQSVTSPWRESA